MSQPFINKIILDVIEKGLDALGSSPKQAIWSFLENDYNIEKDELPRNIKDFQDGLQKIFGLGYNFLDALFCDYLQQATGKQFAKNQNFVECVESLSGEVLNLTEEV
ncbi:MAG: hypothetical protein IAX21_02605 [Candidatus Bathyarchaeota archaeon]|nr:hypothetical protein [Candidatus Bathyarchaeum tardum]WGM90093.1 MAG: hypothetical protein NUK63_02970 [Candidatus Bathyarchaeum tardum]WNZ29769.1 MAG: hypothetical protein IAX21_02605 [Candidatus Bathyarchaeota archaeon]